ncbi:MAG: metallophosphoesterase [Sphingomonas bacterium]|uniref:metallophosphoesterase family protein n=1 Tax=Sphingomonas bacterium TaxID=1895847 RepID=UPI00262ACA96|nr:metallophosphoesterase [Sphingomonas bacterium]MDB5712381.1 metallophosphoesterase [Sphingomonas bacterium]
MTRLFHVSDVHFGAEDPGAIAWFDALVKAERPDAVVMTGDLTMRARSNQFSAAAAWLQGLGVPVTVEVGNHDLPYFNPWKRFVTPYHRYEVVERLAERPLKIDGLAIVPLKTTARVHWRFDWSKGHIAKSALTATLDRIAKLPPGTTIIVACHHPLVGSGTRGGDKALAALAGAGVVAVLSGHMHDPFDLERTIAGHAIRLIGAGTLSERLRGSRPSFNEIGVEAGELSVSARVMA